jgi:phosphotriesterase-related protein
MNQETEFSASFVRTVWGDIDPARLGVCYAHEHIIIDPSFTTLQTPDFLLDSVEAAVAELADFRSAGGRALVDSMPCDSGRNVLKLAEISAKSNVHIVCPTGLHLAKYYDPAHWGSFYGEEELTELFVTEIEQGIDARDCNGPFLRRTSHKAGVLKVATGETITGRDQRLLAAAARSSPHRLSDSHPHRARQAGIGANQAP